MNNTNNTDDRRRREGVRERGQVLPMFLCFLVVLLLFVGMGIDLGFAYITQARLSKAVDAAALAGMNNYYQGTNPAVAIAKATFAANFSPNTNDAAPGYVTGTPIPSITFSNSYTSTSSNIYLNVSASATNKTFFIGMLNYRTLTVSDTAQATRLPLIMTLVLDHSGSMNPNCQGGSAEGCSYGGLYLPAAVDSFIQDFDPGVDQVAVVSFGSSATYNVPMNSDFQANNGTYSISTAVNDILWDGGTCSVCGLTNALNIENSIGSTATAVKVVVFFTDGMANMITVTSAAPTDVSSPWNVGGYLSGNDQNGQPYPVGFFPTNAVDTQAGQNDCQCENDTQGYCSQTQCPDINRYPKFQSFTGMWTNFTMDAVINDATNRGVLVANQMQQAGMYVFCVGFDPAAGQSADVPDPGFLQAVANDPANLATYNPALPPGSALVTGDGSQLAQVFQLIAAQIQQRLTR
jgi:Flp pilus assembly protein TadG